MGNCEWEIVTFYHESLLEVLQKIYSKYKQTKDRYPHKRYNMFVKIARSALTDERVELWSLGTWHFRQDLTKLDGVNGVMIKTLVKAAWCRMKEEGRKSVPDTKTKTSFKSKKGEKKRLTMEVKNSIANLSQELRDMSIDFAISIAALMKLRRAYDRAETKFPLFNYFRLKRCLKAFYAVYCDNRDAEHV